MTLASYFLVTYSYKRKLVRKAGFVYLIMTHIGTVFIASAFFLMLGVGGGWDFAALASNSTGLLPVVKNFYLCFDWFWN